MSISETKLTARLVKAWRAMGYDALNITGSGMQSPGWPDIYLNSSVWRGFIEFKGPKTVVQKHQAALIERLCKSHSPVRIVRFLELGEGYWRVRIDFPWSGDYTEVTLVGETDGKIAALLLKELSGTV